MELSGAVNLALSMLILLLGVMRCTLVLWCPRPSAPLRWTNVLLSFSFLVPAIMASIFSLDPEIRSGFRASLAACLMFPPLYELIVLYALCRGVPHAERIRIFVACISIAVVLRQLPSCVLGAIRYPIILKYALFFLASDYAVCAVGVFWLSRLSDPTMAARRTLMDVFHLLLHASLAMLAGASFALRTDFWAVVCTIMISVAVLGSCRHLLTVTAESHRGGPFQIESYELQPGTANSGASGR